MLSNGSENWNVYILILHLRRNEISENASKAENLNQREYDMYTSFVSRNNVLYILCFKRTLLSIKIYDIEIYEQLTIG